MSSAVFLIFLPSVSVARNPNKTAPEQLCQKLQTPLDLRCWASDCTGGQWSGFCFQLPLHWFLSLEWLDKNWIDLNAITVPKGCTMPFESSLSIPNPFPHRLEIVMYVSLPETVVGTLLDKALRCLKWEDFPMSSWLSISLTVHTGLRQFYCVPFFACIALFASI